MKRVSLLRWLAILWILSGCSVFPAARVAESQGLPTPTDYTFFDATNVPISTSDLAQPAGGTPTVARFFSQHATATPMVLPTSVPLTDVPSTVITTTTQVITTTVFTDQLNPNWSLVTAPGMQVDQANSTHIHSGSVSLAMTPQTDFSKLSFLVNQNTNVAYPRDQVMGVSFWLNSGNEPVNLSDLAVTVLGSNAYPYWMANDNSVPTDNKIFFQETRLYNLGLNRAIPPETWIQVTVYLDKLIYDPDYKYVTGFYIKNDAGFLRTVYIDDVNLLMISDNAQPAPSLMPTGTSSPTPTNTPGPTLVTPTITPNPTPTAIHLVRPSATSTPRR